MQADTPSKLLEEQEVWIKEINEGERWILENFEPLGIEINLVA